MPSALHAWSNSIDGGRSNTSSIDIDALIFQVCVRQFNKWTRIALIHGQEVKHDIRGRVLMRTEKVTVSYGGKQSVASLGEVLNALPHLRDWLGESTPCIAIDISAPWLAQITWAVEDGSAEPVRVDLRGRDDQAITPKVWRSIPIGEVVEAARTELVRNGVAIAEFTASHGYLDASERTTEDIAALKPRRGRPAQFTSKHYQRVAQEYLEARRTGSRAPERAVISKLTSDPSLMGDERYAGLDNPGDRRVKGWIATAKKMGLIPTAKG